MIKYLQSGLGKFFSFVL